MSTAKQHNFSKSKNKVLYVTKSARKYRLGVVGYSQRPPKYITVNSNNTNIIFLRLIDSILQLHILLN